MIGKNNKKLKDLKQGVKVESYSIKKFKFGAASIVIGASIFFGTGVASANEVAASSDSSATNDTNATSGNGDKVPEKINTVSAEKENVASVNKPSSVKEESTKVEVEKKVVDKSLLETSITKLEELLATVNKDKAPASTLSAVNVDLINAKSILENANASQEEVDALVKKLKQQTQIVSSMPKVTTKEKEVKEGANTIANSGSRDSRNGQSMREGTQFRADSAISSGALANIKYFASVDPGTNNGSNTRNNDPEFTKNKTDIKAYYMEDSQGKWIVYDVFFNNDGRKMTGSSYQQQYYFQAPFNIMDPSNTVRDLSFTRYENVGGRRLSDGFQGFKQYGNTATISNPWGQQYKIFNNDGYSFYDPNSGVTRDNQRWDVFKNNQYDSTLNTLTKDKNGKYPRLSYYLTVKLGRESTDYAMHMHAKIKLKNNITEEEAKAYGRVYAASTTSGWTTNQSYIMGTTGTSLTPKDTTPPTITANGATVIKNEKIVDIPVTAEDNKGGVGMRPNNPIEVTGLPQGLTFTNGKITGTPTGPVGNSTVTIKAYDKNGNKAEKTITITVKDQASKYNPTGETLTVNQGQTISDDAVKAKVKNYAPGSLTVLSKPSTAKPGNVGNAVVKVTYPDGSTENVNVPVTVLEAPDNQPPTLEISPKDQTVVEGEQVTFTLTARDNKVVNIDFTDFANKYLTRLQQQKASSTYTTNTDGEKVIKITITTEKGDIGKTNTITFNATDNAGNKANNGKPVTFTFNVTPRDNEKPKASLNGVTLSETANEPIFTVYRGATFNPELKVSDNSGVISKVEVKGGLPKGVNPSTFTAQTGKTEANPYAERLSSGTVLNTETLGVHESTLHVEGSSPSDSRDFKFKYRVVDIETRNLDEHGIAKVPVASTLNKTNSSKNIDAHNYLKVVDSEDKADRGNNYLPRGMTWTWKDRNGNNLDSGTTLDNSGKYTRTATAIFPGTNANNITDANSTTRTTFAPAEIKRQVILAVTPTAPIVEGKENGSVTITPPKRPDSNNPQDIDKITLTYIPTGKTTPETVTVTKSGNNWTVNGKTPDKVSVSPEGVVTISDAEVADKTEVTAKVSKNIDNVVLESPVARGTANGPLAAEVTNPAPVTEKAPITPVTVVTPNKPGSSITVDGPVNGLTVDNGGNLVGTPTVTDWGPKEEERTVEIPVKLKKGTEEVVVKVPVKIQRDTDGDGIPDVKDPDDDNDGIPDTEDANPKVADKLTGTVTEKTVPEKTPVPANTKVITPSKPGTTITTDKPVNGLTVDNGGNLVGTPTVTDWGPKEEERTVEIPVKLKKGTEEVVVKVPVKIQRDTDGDGIPDVKDPDDDNDGIPDTEDANPKVADKLTGTVTEKTVPEKTPVPANTKVITPSKPGTTITTDKPVNGLTVDNGGNLVGTPTVTDWGPKEEERTVEIPVKLKKGTEEVVVKVPVKIQRDTDGDGIPDVKDPDDDNDGIPDTEDANPKVADKLTGTVTEKTVPEKTPVPANTKVITPSKPGTTITTDKPVNGLTVDNGGNLVGTPTVTDWGPKEEERTVEIPVKLKKGTEEVVVKVPVKIQRDTDGDGIPDVKDPDDDNDGIPDTEDANPKVADKLTGTVTEKTVPEKTPVPANTKVITPSKPGTTITTDKPVNGLTVDNGGNLVGTPTVTDWGPKEEERTVEIPVKLKKGTEEVVVKVPVKIQRDTDGDGIPDVKDPDDDNDGIPDTEDANPKVADKLTGTVTEKTVPEKTPVPANTKVITPSKPGTTITTDKPVNGLTVDNGGNLVGTPTVTDWGPKEEERTVEIPVKLKKGTEEVVVKVPVKIQRDTDGDGIPDVKDPDDDNDGIPDTEDANPKVADKLTGTVTEKTVPEKTPVPANTKVITPSKPGTTITTDKPVNGLTVDNGGNLVGTPTVTDWGPKEEERTVEIPVKLKKGTEEVVVKVPVKIQRDTDGDGIPDVKDPDDDNDGIPDEEEIKNGTDPKTPTTQTPKIEITQQPNGDAIVTPKKPDGSTYPPGTKVEIPGENGTPITVTIGNNGSGEVPNDNLPKKAIPGTGTVTEPNKNPSKKVPVETPAHKTPKLELEQDPKTGDVTVTPKKPDGSQFPPGTKVEIPGKDKDHPITVTTDDNGKAKVPNADLPEGKVPGTGKITEPGKPTEEVPVETPSKIIPGAPTTEQPVAIEINQKPNGDAVVTPKKQDGKPYPPGTKVEIPGEDKDGNPITITVTIGDNGSGEVPNDNLPKKAIPGTGTVTEPNKNPSEKVPVETPAHKTPKLELEQDPKTGDVTVTPKKPDGSQFPPGTKVEIPGKDKDGNPTTITVTIDDNGKGKVPNADLPEGKVPGTGKITEPGKPTEEVPVETPAHKTPKLELEQDPKTGDVTVTPKRPDGSTYPPGTTVEIPGKDKDHPITVTTDDNGKAKVPNADLPEGKVPGTGKITEPGRPTEEVPVETPAHKTPKLELEQDPKTGDVTVTPKKPDGSQFPPGTKVEIPGKDKDGNPTTITVTIDDNGKGKVPNADLPEGKVPGTGKITEPGKPTEEVPVETPAHKTPKLELEQDPKTGDVTVTPKRPDGSTYPPGTTVEIPGKDKDHPITVTTDDNGKAKVPNADLPEGKVPGTGKITEPGRPTEEVPVETPAHKTPKLELEQDPKTGDVTVTPKRPDGSTYPPGTTVEIPGKDKDHPITVTTDDNGKAKVPNADLPEGKVPGTGKITEPGRPTEEVPVETPAHKTPKLELEQDPKTGDVTVTPKRPDGSTYPPGTTVEIPGKDKDHPITVTTDDNGKAKVPNADLPEGKVPGTGKITEPGRPTEEVPVETPAHKTPKLELEQDPKTGDVTVTPKRPDGSTYPPGTTVEIPGKDKDHPITVTTDDNGKAKVPNADLPEGKVPGTGKITEPGRPTEEVPVETPAHKTPKLELEQDPKTGDVTVTPKRPDGSTYPPGTTVEIPGKDKDHPITVTTDDNGKAKVPNADLPEGKVPGTGKITEPGRPTEEVPVETPAHKTPTLDVEQDPKTGDVTVTPKKPDGSTYPPGTTVEIPGENGPITVTIGENGKGKVPNDNLPKKEVPGTGKITEPGKPTVEVPNVTTPGKFTPETPVTEQPGEIEITRKPNGDAVVTPKKPDGSTYPPGTTVEIPGENGTTITVTIGDNGSGEVPNDKLPKGNVPGKGTVTEPNKKPSQPVDVTTPARKTPTIDVERDPKTGDVTVTPKKPDGSTYPPGTTVEIPGENGPITVTIGENGKGKVPNDNLPKKEVPGTGKITEPGKPTVEVPNVTTPAKVTPETPVTEQPGEIEITRKPNGDAVVTPKKPDGSTYPPGTTVEIPGENGTTITVTIGDNGSGEVPNDKLPKGNVPGKGTVTEPNKKPSQPVDVTTPARKTPTIDVERDPKTGDVTVTPKKPDGSTYPPGTTVEIPGENGPITVTIGENGKGKVPNDNLPKKEVPGTGKITEPGKPTVEVPNVTTPGKFTPETPVTEQPGEIEITRKPNGDAVVTPKKPDGSTYPPGTTVEIPGENGTTITVTIGDNGSGEVPNDKLPKGNVPGKGTVTEPNKKPSQPVDVTTPARKTPTIDVERDPKTGDVTVTPKKPDGSTYPPGTTVEIPGENGPITVTIGENGKGKVPNDNLPKKEVPGTGKITEPGKPTVEVPNVTTPGKFTPETPVTEQPGEIEITRKPNGDAVVTPKKPDGSTYPPGTTVEIPGENGTTITVTIGDNGSGEVPNDKLPKGNVPGKGTVTEPNKKPSQPVDVTTPARKTPTIDVERDPKTGDVTVTPKKPDGSTYPPGTTVEIPGENGPITVTIGENGKGKVPNDNLPKKEVPGTGKITEPGKPTVEVPNVTTPAKVTPETPVTEQPGEIEITRKPNGDAVVTPKKPDGSTYPPGTTVEIPGENGTTITVTIGDNGSGEVPNDKLPKGNVPGKGTVTEPNKKPSQPVDVTTPARKTPTIDVERDPKTGDVTVTPKKPDGSTYPPGTTVEIPGENGPITVTIGENGKGKVPNDNLPKKEVPGTGKITEPGKPTVEVPNVTTPGKFTPETPVTEQPGEIEITRKPNGDAVVTPKKPDGSTYPPGTTVEIPGEDGTTITVTIGDNGSGEVPNDNLPKGNVPGKGTVTEPNKKPSQPVDVTTPARKTPTLDVEQDPKTGDVTVTPKKPDGSTYPPGTKVEIPGKDGNTITVTIGEDGKGKVPNSELPEGKVPGTGKITEPGKPAVEVPVTTPAKVRPNTPTNAQVDNGNNRGKTEKVSEIKKDTKRLANTGTTETNTGLAGLGLGILGGLLAAARRRKNDKN